MITEPWIEDIHGVFNPDFDGRKNNMVDYKEVLVPLHEEDWEEYRTTEPEEDNPIELLMEKLRPTIQAMEPEKRRRFCADLKAILPEDDGKTTGRFFNGFASASRPREPGKELGKRIMAKRNANYRPDEE